MNYADILYAKKLAGGGGSAPTLIEKEITENGTYIASEEGADGYSKVIVDIPMNNNANFYHRPQQTAFDISAILVTRVDIPEGYTEVESGNYRSSLRQAINLKHIGIPSTVKTLVSNMFANCTLLETITINKPEGSITGAPWGAPDTCQIIWTG